MNRRMDRVNVLLRQGISQVVANELRDPRLASVVSITRVRTSSDLRHAKVFFSVFGDESEKRNTLQALRSGAGFVHRLLRKQVSLRLVPSLEFQLDESIEQGTELLQMIDEVTPSPTASDAPQP